MHCCVAFRSICSSFQRCKSIQPIVLTDVESGEPNLIAFPNSNRTSADVLYIDTFITNRLENNIDDTTPIHSEWWRNINIDESQLVPSSVLEIDEVHDGVIYEYQLDGFHEHFVMAVLQWI